MLNDSLLTSKSAEWYTPPKIINRVMRVMGAIDLDPCADSDRTIPAAQHYTAIEDGLAQSWHGRVYMNPPYGDVIKQWIDKIMSEYRSGNVTEAIALVPARTDTAWFDPLYDYPICFVRGRLKFSGHDNSAPFPSAVVYLGRHRGAFVEAFQDIGRIVSVVGSVEAMPDVPPVVWNFWQALNPTGRSGVCPRCGQVSEIRSAAHAGRRYSYVLCCNGAQLIAAI